MTLQSKLFRGDPKLEAAAVSNAAHIVPGAVGEHVAKIQQALIQLDGAAIAGDELAARSYGPSTADAVLSYKKKRDIINRSYQTQADDIVGIMTMAALDREMSKSEGPLVPILARSSQGMCFLLKGGDPKPDPMLPNPYIVGVITALVPDVRRAIAAANFNLLAAEPFVTTHKQKIPTGPFQEQARQSLVLLDVVFDFFKFDNPRPVFENFRRVYFNMNVALNRSFETAPLIAPTLFVANIFELEEKKAAAYTGAGGAFLGPEVKLAGLGVPANRIYLCSNLAALNKSFKIFAALHELAHYVSGHDFLIVDHFKGNFHTDPKKFKGLPKNLKIRDAEHYAVFAFLAAFRQHLFD